MTPTKRIYLDTNILIEMVEGTGPQTNLSIEIFASNDGTIPAYLVTSELTLAEVLVQPMARKLNKLIQAYDNVLNNGAALQTGPVDREVLSKAAFMRSIYQSLKLPDAIHVATALILNCTHFLTSDARLKGHYEIPRTGQGVNDGAKSVLIIRPTLEVLTGLSTEFTR